jgi:hypothetical protein
MILIATETPSGAAFQK